MSRNLKEQLLEIIKAGQQAEPAPPPPMKFEGKPKGKPQDGKSRFSPPPGSAPEKPGAGTGTRHPSGGGAVSQVSSGAIRNMQKAIQQFAHTSVDYQKGKPERDKSGKIVYKISDEDKRRNFNDFLAEQFSASADIHGEEYSTDLGAINKDDKLPTDLIQLNNVINGLQRIGPGSKEALPDGRWDFRTNNAVKNVYAIATALVAANEALGGAAPNDPRVFRKTDLAKFKQLIPIKLDETPAVLSAKAEQITALIEKLTRFYSYYSKTIMEHPAYRDYVNDTLPLLTVKPGKDPAQLDAPEIERMKRSTEITLPYLRVMDKDNRPINIDGRVALSYLQNRQSLQKMMIDLLGFQPNEVNNDAAMRRVVKNLIARINSVIENNKPVQKTEVAQPTQPNPQNIA